LELNAVLMANPVVPPPALASQAVPSQKRLTVVAAPAASAVAMAPSPSPEEAEMILNTGSLVGKKLKVSLIKSASFNGIFQSQAPAPPLSLAS